VNFFVDSPEAGASVSATEEPGGQSSEESGSFLKKRTKKLLSVARCRRPNQENTRRPEIEQKFFGSFFQKRTASLLMRGTLLYDFIH
jgi:hypothetical protein